MKFFVIAMWVLMLNAFVLFGWMETLKLNVDFLCSRIKSKLLRTLIQIAHIFFVFILCIFPLIYLFFL